MSVTLDHAMQLYRLGLCVLPATAEKRPACAWKRYQFRRPDENQLRRWWGSDRPGVGALMGPVSGSVACRDFDEQPEYDRWAHEHPALAKSLPTAITARGRHVYARVSAQQTEPLRGVGGGQIQVEGGEVRLASGCFCVLPPSLHPTGVRYRWAIPPTQGFPEIDLFAAGWGLNTDDTGLHRMLVCRSESSESSESSVLSRVELLIQRTLPERYGRRTRRLFEFVRQLKAIDELAPQHPRELRQYVKLWHAAALPNIRTTDFDTTFVDFVGAWERCHHAAGDGPVNDALARALQKQPSARILAASDNPQVHLLALICGELQSMAGDRPFFLDCRSAASAIRSVSHVTAAAWLKLLCIQGVIKEVSKGSREKHRASEYQFLLDATSSVEPSDRDN